MAGSTDTRVVQLQFENRQFERNIAKSKKSLDDLKPEIDSVARLLNGLRLHHLTEINGKQ